jgi:hypothetical protein
MLVTSNILVVTRSSLPDVPDGPHRYDRLMLPCWREDPRERVGFSELYYTANELGGIGGLLASGGAHQSKSQNVPVRREVSAGGSRNVDGGDDNTTPSDATSASSKWSMYPAEFWRSVEGELFFSLSAFTPRGVCKAMHELARACVQSSAILSTHSLQLARAV